MGKKVKEYKSGDFIFAKVKGYPAWPARVQRLNGKKYYVYFYGTGETANLPPNMIFDYAENKDKFLTKTVKRRDFNDGVKQIEHDFANNVPLEEVIGAGVAEPPAEANDTINDTGNDTMEDSAIDTTAADDTVADTTASNATQNDTVVEDSDDAGALVIDEGKQQAKNRKSKVVEPAKTLKTPKTARGKPKKDDKKDEEDAVDKEELVSRSGRKIRPKRYLDEQTEDNATLPSPAPKKKRGTSPQQEKEKEKEKEREGKEKSVEKNIKHFNNVARSDIEDLKEPFKPADAEKENILIGYLPSGQYVGIKLFQSRPANFKDEAARLQWDKQSAKNSLKLLTQLEKGQITPQSVMAQLVMDLNLTEEEKATLDKERETEEKKSRVQFLKTEMRLIELDAKIKTCLCLERADTEQCLKLLDQLLELDIKPLMLLKHPTCLETVKRMRAYVGNTPSWDLSEPEAINFAKQAHAIRKQAHRLYTHTMELFNPPETMSSWEYFSGLVLQFKKATADLGADQLLELVHEPIEMTQPSAVTMSAAIEAVNTESQEEETPKKKNTRSKKGTNSTPSKPALKRQSSRKQEENKEKDKDNNKKQTDETDANHIDSQTDKNTDKTSDKDTTDAEPETGRDIEENADKNKDTEASNTQDKENEQTSENEKENETEKDTQDDVPETEANDNTDNAKETSEVNKENAEKVNENSNEETESNDNAKESSEEATQSSKETDASNKETKQSNKAVKDSNKETKDSNKDVKENSKDAKENSKDAKDNKEAKESSKEVKESNKRGKDSSEKGKKGDKGKESSEKAKESSEKGKESSDSGKKTEEDKEDEPRAKRARGENKKTEPPPRSPAKRKAKV